VHDEAAPSQEHGRDERFAQPKGAEQIHLEHTRQIFALGVEQPAQRRRAQRARVVDDDVDRAEHGLRLADDAVDGLFLADVGANWRDAYAFELELPCALRESRRVLRDERDLRAAPAELARQRKTEPARRSRDHHRGILPVHGHLRAPPPGSAA
jgi:hypothetical protein